MGDDELTSLLVGYGHRPIFVRGDEPADVHQQLAAALDDAWRTSPTSKRPPGVAAVVAADVANDRPFHPKRLDVSERGRWLPVEGTFRAHQVPVADVRANPGHLKILEDWLQSYRPEELFDESGASASIVASPGADRETGA